MKNTIKVNNTELKLMYASKMFSGHGHYKITVLFLNVESGENKSFTATTSHMPGIDAASELEDTDEKYLALYELIQNNIQENIEDWVSPSI